MRTALAVEPRDGMLHVFFPPLYAAEDWLELAAAVEATAAELGRQVVLEGYLPPRRPAAAAFLRHPRPRRDRGQHPSRRAAGPSMVERTEQLYEEARAGRPGDREIHAGRPPCRHRRRQPRGDGRRPTPEDSPFLRRPDLLKSLLGFWHNHPSLSFLFSGLFIGPTSQHPRIDEARDDQLNELEIAFSPDRAVQRRRRPG